MSRVENNRPISDYILSDAVTVRRHHYISASMATEYNSQQWEPIDFLLFRGLNEKQTAMYG